MSQQLMELADGDSFEPGGAGTMPNFLQNLFGGETPAIREEEKKTPEEKKNIKRKEKPKYKFLDAYCTNLCQKAKDGLLDRIIGRENEIYRVVQILSRRKKNNPCLIGEPGVGKTAIAEGIAPVSYTHLIATGRLLKKPL